jgi:DNA-binding NarL/FixJ family response regulator
MRSPAATDKASAEGSAERLPVCLLWRHPLVVAEFRARLAGGRFDVTDLRIQGAALVPPDATLPAGAPLVVVDSDDGAATALLVLDRLEQLNPSARTVVLAEQFDDDPNAFHLLRAGVKGLVTYAEMRERLPQALEAVAAGGFWVPRALLSRFVELTVKKAGRQRPASRTALTPRESEIFEDLLQNLSNKDIAKRRHLTSRTIKFHVSNVLAKYGVKRRADLLLLSFPQH